MMNFEVGMRRVGVALLLGVFVFSGCAIVGTDYERPETDILGNWQTEGSVEVSNAVVDGVADDSIDPLDLEEWWTTFQDETLNLFVDQALTNSHTLQVAVARVAESRARYGVSRGEYYPALAAIGGAAITRQSESLVPNISADQNREDVVYQVGFTLSWELDLWGRIRRLVESSKATMDASIDDRRDVQVLLVADVASAYMDIRSLQARVRVALDNIESQKETLGLTQDRFAAGLVPKLDVYQAELNLARTSSSLPRLRSLLIRNINRLALLVGTSPGEIRPRLDVNIPTPKPLDSIATGIPVDVILDRADVQRSERLLASQLATMGVASAARFPTLSLSGTFAMEALESGNLFESGNEAYSFGPSVRWRIFEGGRIYKSVMVEESRVEQLYHIYQQTVLAAIEDIETSMVLLTEERDRLVFLQKAVTAAHESVTAVKDLYQNGLITFQNVLDMERSLAQQQDDLKASEGLVSKYAIRLYKALGGEGRKVKNRKAEN